MSTSHEAEPSDIQNRFREPDEAKAQTNLLHALEEARTKIQNNVLTALPDNHAKLLKAKQRPVVPLQRVADDADGQVS